MDRRTVLAAAGALGLAAATRADAATGGWRRYRLTAEIDLAGHAGPAQLWVPLAQTAPGYQTASAARFAATGEARVVRDRRYGAAMLHVSWPAADAQRTVKVEQTIATRDRGLVRGQLSARERQFWTAAIPSMPTDGIVGATARRIVGDATRPRAKARAIYDWVVDNTFRDAAVRGCGIGGVEGMLQHRRTWAASAPTSTASPSRSAAAPACGAGRLSACNSAPRASSPRSAPAKRRRHPRPALPRRGLARRRGLAADRPGRRAQGGAGGQAAGRRPRGRAERERLFGSWEMNWAGYNSATDVELPGATQAPREHFLMYPLATDAGRRARPARPRQLPLPADLHPGLSAPAWAIGGRLTQSNTVWHTLCRHTRTHTMWRTHASRRRLLRETETGAAARQPGAGRARGAEGTSATATPCARSWPTPAWRSTKARSTRCCGAWRRQGLLTSEWREEEKRNKRFYRLSDDGAALLSELTDEWRDINAALNRLL